MKDVVHISLFDQIEFDDSAQGGFLEGETTVRIEKRYLGRYCYLHYCHIYNMFWFADVHAQNHSYNLHHNESYALVQSVHA
jgi:hypothetical protein